MNNIELIPMQPDYRQSLKYSYFKPLIIRLIFCFIFLVFTHALILFNILNTAEEYITIATNGIHKTTISRETFIVSMTISFFTLSYMAVSVLSRIKRHYYKDYRFGNIIKEHTHISNVMETPAGINIYWLDSESIFTFTPDPYVRLAAGDTVIIYYLKYAKEYLRYELP